MMMNPFPSSIRRVKHLKFLNPKLGDNIIFCPKCPFQKKLNGMGMQGTCPDCRDGTRLHTICVCKELLDLLDSQELRLSRF